MFISAAGAYLSRAAAVLRKRPNLPKNSQPTANIAAVLATTDLNLLNYRSSAVARGTSYSDDLQLRRSGAVAVSTAVEVLGAWARFADI